MNKLVIPTILLATVMVAGMFAFMPVEQASTIHAGATGVQASQAQIQQAEDLTVRTATGDDQVSTVTIGTDNNTPFLIKSIIVCATSDDGTGDDADREASINTITIDDDVIEGRDGLPLDLGSIINDGANSVSACLNVLDALNDINNRLIGKFVGSDGGNVVITIELGDAGDVLNSVKVVALVDGSSTLTVTSGDPA